MFDFLSKRSPQRFFWLSAALVVLMALANSGTIQWSDNGLFLARAADDPWFSTDLSEMSHPLFHLTAVLAYHLGGAVGLTWLNVLLLPVIGALVHRLSRQLGADPVVAAAATAGALSVHCLLWVGTKVEVYILHLTLVLACWAVYFGAQGPGPARPWRLLLVGVLAGMALSVHQLTMIVLAPLALLLVWESAWLTAWAAVGFVLGLFACLPAFLDIHGHGALSTIDIVRCFLTGGGDKLPTENWEHMFLRVDHLRSKLHLVATVLVSLFGLGGVGLLSRPSNRRAWMLWLAAVMNLVFAATYDVPDRFTFFLPGAVMFAVLGAMAVGRRETGWFSRPWLMPLILVPVLACHLVPLVAAEQLMKMPRVKSPAPYFNPLTYYFSPLVPDRSARRFTREFEQVVPRGGVVYADFLSIAALLSAQKVGVFEGRSVRSCPEFDFKHPPASSFYIVQALECEHLMPYVTKTLPLGFEVKVLAPAAP